MKVCPKCNKNYDDDNLNFCLNDGELLLETESVDAPPTIMMDAPRQTNENLGNFETGFPNQNQTDQQNQQIFQTPFGSPQNMMMTASKDQTLPIVALVAGILSVVMSCCYLGILFGPVGLIVGFIGISNVNKNSEAYDGKSLAVVGMVLGGVGFVLSFLFILLNALGRF
jgi:hypothetical protein